MLKKLDQWLGMKKIAAQNALNSLIYEEKGATGMIEIIVLIVIIIAVAGIFRIQLSKMVSQVFSKLTEFIQRIKCKSKEQISYGSGLLPVP